MKNKISERKFLAFYLSLTALLYIVTGLQGYDMCDEGWVLTGFQQIFNDPASVQYLFLYYLSDCVGGVWNAVFGDYGIVAFRVLGALFMTATTFVVYKLLRPYTGRWSLAVGSFWIFLCYGGAFMVFYHDHLTTFLAAAASYLLFLSLMKNRPSLMFLSGVMLGINVFARLPNLSLTLLILLLVPYHRYGGSGRDTLHMAASAVTGFIIGVGAVLLLMWANGHTGVFIDAVSDGFSAVEDTQSNHNFGEMCRIYALNYIEVLRDTALLFAVPAVVLLVRKRRPGLTLSPRVRIACAILTAAISVILNKFTAYNTSVIYALSTATCLFVMLSKRFDKPMKYLSLIVLINMHALPLGSDYGISNMGVNCIWLSAPFTVGVFGRLLHERRHDRDVFVMLAVCAVVTAGVIMKRGVGGTLLQCYFDEGSRFKKTYLIDSPLATTFTTEKNAETLSPMLKALSAYVDEDDYLLCFQNIATVHYLTRTRPYLYNPWVWTYDPGNMERKFERAERERPYLPVVVRDKSMLPHWYEYYPDWNNENAPESYLHNNKKIMLINRFLTRHRYRKVWENDVLQILVPPSLYKRP